MSKQICSMCKSIDNIINDYQYRMIVCQYCGLVYEENIISPANEKNINEAEGDPANNELKDLSAAPTPL